MKKRHLAALSAALILCLQFNAAALAASIDWRTDIASAAAEAKSTNRFMFVEISAPWCPACRRLEKLMESKKIAEWTNPRFVSVHLSADAPNGKALLQKFGLHGIPALLVFTPDGRFTDKMSGGPSDVEGFKYFLTKLAGGEAALANVGMQNFGNSNNANQNVDASNFGAPPNNYQQGYAQSQQPIYQSPPAPQQFQQTQQYPQQSQQFQQPVQQYSQPPMQWQGQQPLLQSQGQPQAQPPAVQMQVPPQDNNIAPPYTYQQTQQNFQQQYQQQLLGPQVHMNPVGGPNQYPSQSQFPGQDLLQPMAPSQGGAQFPAGTQLPLGNPPPPGNPYHPWNQIQQMNQSLPNGQLIPSNQSQSPGQNVSPRQ